jgi:PAS domain S-box-containing protein
MIKTPWRTDWLETVAAFMLIAAAVVAHLRIGFFSAPFWLSPVLISALALAASAVVMGNHLMTRSFFRSLAGLFGAAVFLGLSALTIVAGSSCLAVVFAVMGIFMTLAAFRGGVAGMPEKRPPETIFVLAAAVILLVWGAIGLVRLVVPALRIAPDSLFGSDPVSLILSLSALVAGAALAYVARHRFDSRNASVAATVLGSVIFAVEVATSFMAGQYGASFVYFTLAVGLPVSMLLTRFTLNCDPAVFSRLSDKQTQIYRHRRFGEGIVIAWFAIAGLVYVVYHSDLSLLFFAALAAIYLIITVAFHANSMKSLTERHHGLVLFSYLAITILTVHVTGGFESNILSLFYVLMVMAFTALSSGWAWAFVLTCVMYVLGSFTFVYATGPVSMAQWLQFLARIFAITITGFYGILMLKDRQSYESKIRSTTDRLMEALSASSREKDRFEQQARQLLGLNTDLTDTRTALLNVLEDVEEAKLRIERDARRDATILSSLGEGLIAATADRKVFLHNQAMARLTGFGGSTALGRDIGEVLRLVREIDNVPDTQMLDSAFAGQAAACPEKLEIIAADGTRVPIAGTAAPFQDEVGRLQGIVVALRDITVERDVNRQRSGFISIASHQLRTPLSTTRWYLDVLLAGDVGALSTEQADLLSDLQVSNIRMIKLVNDLLDVNRIESGRVQFKPVLTDVKPLLESIIAKEFTVLAEKKKQKLEVNLADGLPELLVDPEGMRQAFSNLVANAINYTPVGGLIRVTYGQVGEEAVIEVKDTGIGVPEAEKHRLFSQFFRAANAIATETVGSGLGLYITRLMVEASGGRVWFESKPGEGSRFFIAFPLKLAAKK